MAGTIRVALVNDYIIVLEGLRALLETSDGAIEVVELDIEETPKQKVDITLLDTYGSPDVLEKRVRELSVDPHNGSVVVFSFSDQSDAVDQALRAGAQGFISKAVRRDEIVEGVKAVARGERVVLTQRSRHSQIDAVLRWPGRDTGLTERESELLSLLSTGMTNRELGQHLYISENTVKTQLRHLYRKLGVRNRAQAASLGAEGLLGERRGSPQSAG